MKRLDNFMTSSNVIQQQIQQVIEREETLFLKTLDKGMEILNEVIEKIEETK